MPPQYVPFDISMFQDLVPAVMFLGLEILNIVWVVVRWCLFEHVASTFILFKARLSSATTTTKATKTTTTTTTGVYLKMLRPTFILFKARLSSATTTTTTTTTTGVNMLRPPLYCSKQGWALQGGEGEPEPGLAPGRLQCCNKFLKVWQVSLFRHFYLGQIIIVQVEHPQVL